MKVTTKQWANALEAACDGASEKQIGSVAAEFVRMLAKRGELARVRDVIRNLTVSVTAETAHPLKPAARKAIEEAAGAPVTELINKDLIGGMRLRVGDRVLDGSVAGQLERLKRTLAE